MKRNKAKTPVKAVRSSSRFRGWQILVDNPARDPAEIKYPLPAYSEFMPGPRLGVSPYGDIDYSLFPETDPFGWSISEVEEEYHLQPGLKQIAGHIMEHLLNLGRRGFDSQIGERNQENLRENPYWPLELSTWAVSLAHERYVTFLPLALSIAQDDKGRLLWTFFGGSEQGPETVFWKGFFSSPGKELPVKEFYDFISVLLDEAYGEKTAHVQDLRSLGFRILPTTQDPVGELLPSWTKDFLIPDDSPLENVRFLLTFRPFANLPEEVKKRYLNGGLNLLPFPGSLVFWGMPTYRHLQEQLPLAGQIPLLRLVPRHHGPAGIRVPQSGWIDEFTGYTRTHRWERHNRFEDELSGVNPRLEKLESVLFSTDLDVMGLYDKPLARNCQLWTGEFDLLLDGPRAARADLKLAEEALKNPDRKDGEIGYRFLFPAAQVGPYEVYWHRPLVAYLPVTGGFPVFHPNPPLGYLTAYLNASPDLHNPVELWPRIQNRPDYHSALEDFHNPHDRYINETPLNLITLLDTWHLLDERRLPASFVRHLLRIPREVSLENWIADLSKFGNDLERAHAMQARIHTMLAGSDQDLPLGKPITYSETASRSFELAYWQDIKTLSEGDYRTKDNADCILNDPDQKQGPCQGRDLDSLGDYLIAHHKKAIHQAGMDGRALCGEVPFQWNTDFDFPHFGGWQGNQENTLHERDILVVIPGKRRDQAVILADHYDTAYMEDTYRDAGARYASHGADDNCSATATLLQAAPIYLMLAKQGRLERDIWLLHLTGEEFPADCLGARHFCQMLIEKKLQLYLEGSAPVNLSSTRVTGVFLMDMIAHNREINRDIFEISPGRGRQAMRLALQAHRANMIWNDSTRQWNENPVLKAAAPARRSPDGKQVPPVAAHLPLIGEIRTHDDRHSSLYNTDGQIFSDAGIPVVLFMENYDIERSGYHDTKDTMENIDLDYGAALAAIAIESCARMAMDL